MKQASDKQTFRELVDSTKEQRRLHLYRMEIDRWYRWRQYAIGIKDWILDKLWSVWRFIRPVFYRRTYRYFWQRRTRGWDDSELWALDVSFARWMLPRLIRIREVMNERFHREPEEDARMMTAIVALTILADDRHSSRETVKKGLKIIAEDIGRWWT